MAEKHIRMTLIGPPGCGTILKVFRSNLKSTGDLLRKEVQSGSTIGAQAKEIMKRGELVPDDIILQLVRNAIKQNHSFILDGFPRTVKQAQMLDALLAEEHLPPLNLALELQVQDKELITRITGRRVHIPSGRTYHITYNPPKVHNKDDVTGEDLTQRADDTEDSLKVRLHNYHQSTEPILDYYKKKNIWQGVNGSNDSKVVYTNSIKPMLHKL